MPPPISTILTIPGLAGRRWACCSDQASVSCLADCCGRVAQRCAVVDISQLSHAPRRIRAERASYGTVVAARPRRICLRVAVVARIHVRGTCRATLRVETSACLGNRASWSIYLARDHRISPLLRRWRPFSRRSVTRPLDARPRAARCAPCASLASPQNPAHALRRGPSRWTGARDPQCG